MSGSRGTQDSPPSNRTSITTPNEYQYAQDLQYIFNNIACTLKQSRDDTLKNLADLATFLDKDQTIYWCFGAADGFVLAYSMIKYPVDLLYNASKTETAKTLRNWLHTPKGFAIALAWLAFLSIVSAYANGVSKQKDPTLKDRYVLWQATRDAMKGLRNIHRGLKGAFDVMQLLVSIDARYLLLPLGLILGIPSAYNRWWYRHMIHVRKKTMDDNDVLSEELLTWGRFDDTLTHLPADKNQRKETYINSYLLINKNDKKNRRLYYINHEGTEEDLELNVDDMQTFLNTKAKMKFYEDPNDSSKDQKNPHVLQWHHLLNKKASRHFSTFTDHIAARLKINTTTPNQAHNDRAACKRSVGYGGFVDGLYLFIPFVSLITFSPGALAVVALLSTAFIVAQIKTRIQEEEEFDRLFQISKHKTEFTLSIKRLQDNMVQLIERNTELHDGTPRDAAAHAEVEKRQLDADARLDQAYLNVSNCYNVLQEKGEISDDDATLIGLRHGLAAHGAIVCGIFAASIISTHFFATLLPHFIIFLGVAASLLITVGLIFFIRDCAQEYNKQQKNELSHPDTLMPLIEKIKLSRNTNILHDIEHHEAFARLSKPSWPNWYLSSWIEIFRGLGSGLMKGVKSMDFIVTFLIATSDASEQHEHDHNSPFVWLVLLPALIGCGLIWALRGLAKFSTKLSALDTTPWLSFMLEAQDDTSRATPPPHGNAFDSEGNPQWSRVIADEQTDVMAREPHQAPGGGSLTPQGRPAPNIYSLFAPGRLPKTVSLGSLDPQTLSKARDSMQHRCTSYTADTSGTSDRQTQSAPPAPSNTRPTGPSGP